jgi:1,2-diacylglycerol 3-alpha-glucosyltransferase
MPDRVACVISVSTPYFQARFSGAKKLMPQARIHAVEIGRYSETYAFAPDDAVASFHRHILADAPLERQNPHEMASRLTEALQQIRPDVVLIPGWSGRAAFIALSWCVRNGVPAVAMSESTEWDEKRGVWREAVKRRIVGMFSAALVGGTPHRDYMVQLGMPAERIFLGYDAVDNGYFAENTEKLPGEAAKQTLHGPGKTETLKSEVRSQRSEVRNKFGLPENYFLASARFIEKKNLPGLIEAYARYRTLCEAGSGERGAAPNSQLQASPWGLVLLGDGELRPALCSRLQAPGLQNSVLMPGFKQYPELPAYYGCARAFIHASTTEQWGLVVNEAMASGLPVLVSNRCGCATDLVQDGVNGFTFDPCNVEEMAKAMLKISTFQDVRLSEFGAASARIISNWGPERFAAGLKQAAECALRVGPVKPTLPQRMVLKTLLLK